MTARRYLVSSGEGGLVHQTGVVTPEGVFLDYRPAGLATRAMGRLVDFCIQGLLGYVIMTLALAVFAVARVDTAVIIVSIVLGFVILFGYPVLFEVYGGGRTPGHRATGIRVIRTDGGPVRFRHAAIRAMLFLVDGLATSGFAGAVSVLTTRRGQRLGDLAAGTMVVRLASISAWDNPAPVISPDLAERAKNFDVRRIVQADVALAQLLLDRGPEMFPGAQVDLAERIADRFDEQLGSARADGDGPGDFIAAVVAAHSGSIGLDVSSDPAQDELSEVAAGDPSTEGEAVRGDQIEGSEDEESKPGFAPPT